jgi:hypothetical protein
LSKSRSATNPSKSATKPGGSETLIRSTVSFRTVAGFFFIAFSGV